MGKTTLRAGLKHGPRRRRKDIDIGVSSTKREKISERNAALKKEIEGHMRNPKV